MTPSKVLSLAFVVVVLIVGLTAGGSLVENLDSKEVMVIQGAVDGQLHVYTQPGVYMQNFGKVTRYQRRTTHPIEKQVRFNDGGHATLKGTIQWEMPTAEDKLKALHLQYASQEAIDQQLVETVVSKSVYMTGPLMSSKESYAEKRADVLHFVEDQISGGVYRTRQKDVKVKDPITGVEKTATAVEIVMDEKGLPARNEEAVLSTYGIKTFGLSITELDYDGTVEDQIKAQQQLAMAVQTSIANAKKAEQDAITTEQNGKANAAKAKWDQEVIKAKAVTEAQQQLEVATLNARAEEQRKRQVILQGEGEAERQRLIRQANDNLDQKLEAWKFSQQVWAEAFAKYQGSVVPSIVTGGSGSTQGNGNAALNFMEIMGINAAKQLAVDVTPASGKK